MKKINPALKVLFLLSLIVYSISFCFWGRGNNDVYYWLNLYKANDVSLMVYGTYKIANLWCSIFGFNILSLRILNYLCNITALTLTIAFYYKKNFFSWKVLLCYGMAVLLMGYGTFNEFSPYSLTFLLSSIIICIVLNNKINYWSLFLLGVLSMLLTICRFPNILICPVLIIYILLKSFTDSVGYKKSFLYILIYCLSIFFVFAILLLDYEFNPFNIFNSIENADSSHSIQGLIYSTLDRIPFLFKYCASVVLFYILTLFDLRHKTNIFFLIIVCFLFYLFLTFDIKTKEGANYYLHFFMSAICLCILFAHTWTLYNDDKQQDCLIPIVILCIMLVPSMGSDVSFLKLFPNILILIPLYALSVKKNLRFTYATYTLISIFLLFSLLCYTKNNISKSLPNSKKTLFKMNFYDDNPNILNGIALSKSDKMFNDTILADYNKYVSTCSSNAVFYGEWAHYAYSLLEIPKPYEYNFYMARNDSAQLSIMFNYIEASNNITLFDMRHNDSPYFNDRIKELDLIKQVDRDGYVVYTRNNDGYK